MPVGYGSNFPLSELSMSEVGSPTFVQKQESLPWWYTFTQVLLNVVQVGLAFVPGIGEIADLGIAAAQTGLEKAVTGKVDPLSTALNFGMSGFGAVKGIGQAIKANEIARAAQPLFKQTMSDVTKDIAAQAQRGENLAEQLDRSFNIEAAVDKDSSAWRQAWGNHNQKLSNAIENATQKDAWVADRGMYSAGSARNLVAKRLQQMKDIQAKTEELMGKKFISPKTFQEYLNQAGKQGYGGSVNRLMKQSELLSKTVARARGFAEAGSESAQTSRTVIAGLKSSLELTEHEIYLLRSLINEFGQITNKRMFFSILRKSFQRTNNVLIEAALKQGTQKLIRQLTREETTAARLARVSGQVAKKVTKAMQIATNPGYVVRKFIKETVGKIEEEAIDIAKKKAIAMLAKGGKQAVKLEEMFSKTGGVLMDSSVIMGYKLIADELEWKTMLIKFRPDATGSKSGRNKGGKPDVLVNCNEQDFLAFTKASSKMGFYLDNWAKSRGGRYPSATSLDAIGISNEMVDILGFLPIKQIRPYLALTTMVKRVSTAKNMHFIWQTEYFDKIKADFVGEALKETAGNATKMLPHHMARYAKRAVDSAMDGNGITKISENMIASQARKAERRHRTQSVKKIGTVSKIGVRSVKLFR